MEPISVFVSYSDKDKEVARELASIMSTLRMVPVLPHDDPDGGEQWKEAVREVICNCDILVALVTHNFHESEYTEQEVGAAWMQKKPVLTITTGNVRPLGFIANCQCVMHGDDLPVTVGYILKFALSETRKDDNTVYTLVEMLAEAKSHETADSVASVLVSMSDLTTEQVGAIKSAMTSNSCARSSSQTKKRLKYLFDENNKYKLKST